MTIKTTQSLFKKFCAFTAAFILAVASMNALAADPSSGTAQEFRNVPFNYYFLTSRPAEKALLLAQNTPFKTVWEVTGQSLKVHPKAAENPLAKGLRRFEFTSAFTGASYSSHVYLVSPLEVAAVRSTMTANPTKIFDEGIDGYVLEPVVGSIGDQPSCAKGYTPVWRAFNAGRFHHRYSTDFGFYTDVILANLVGDIGWAKDNEEIKFCAVEPAMRYSLKAVSTTTGTRLTVVDTSAVKSETVKVSVQLPAGITYLSNDSPYGCNAQANSGTLISCIVASTNGQAVLNLSTSGNYTSTAVQAIAIAADAETKTDPRQCSAQARPSFGCAVAVMPFVPAPNKTVIFSPAALNMIAGTTATSYLVTAPADQKPTTVSVFAPRGVDVASDFRRCEAFPISLGTKYVCSFNSSTLGLELTSDSPGGYVLWAVVAGAIDAEACASTPTLTGCTRLNLVVTPPSSPIILGITATTPPEGAVNSPYAWQYSCTNLSDTRIATNVTCIYSALPLGLTSSCANSPLVHLSPRASLQCNVLGTPQRAGVTFFNITASASNADSTSQNTSISIKETIIVPPPPPPIGGISCTDQPTDQQYSYNGITGTGGSFNPRTFRVLGQLTASFQIIPGSHTITAGYPKRYNRFTWEIIGPDFVPGFQMTISPCRGDFTSVDAQKISFPGYTPVDNRVEYAGSIALYFDEPARPPVGTVYSMQLPSNRLWYINIKNDMCLGNQACGTSVYFIDADR